MMLNNRELGLKSNRWVGKRSVFASFSQSTWGWDGVLLLAAFILLTFGIGQYGLFEPHEGHFAGVAREMVLRGDWISPHLNGAPYLNKPPLLYWLIAASYSLFGIHEFAARLPVALASWGGVAIAWLWGRQLWGIIAGRVVALLLSISVGWFIFAHQILIDELLATLLLGMIYCLWQLAQSPQSKGWFIGTYLFLGLAVLAKGILALVFWGGGRLALSFTRRDWRTLWTLRPLMGLGLVTAMVVPWFVGVEQANPGFVQYWFLNEHFKRALDTRWPPDYSVSKISPWGYILVSALWCLPWIVVWPSALTMAHEHWRRGQRPIASIESRELSEALTLLFVLAVLPIVLFLPMSSRLYYYSLPMVPPLAMVSAWWWAQAIQGKDQGAQRWIGSTLLGLGITIASGLLWLPGRVVAFFPELSQTQGVQTLVMVQLIGLGIAFIGSGSFILRRQLIIALVLLWFGTGTSWACVVQGFTTIQDFRSSKTLVQQGVKQLGSQALWIFEGSREMGAPGAMSFYLNPEGVKIAKEKIVTSSSQIVSNVNSLWMLGNESGTPIIAIPMEKGQLSAEWEMTPSETLYPTVLVLTDGGANRLPPTFPGAKPKTLITKVQMQQFWNGDRPVLFVTDFLRIPQDANDPLNLNLPKDSGKPLLEIGPRKLYGNAIARKLWLK
jgi:4-amino-4-deoxy-L-arabinose transferase-like glycosyltransferase